MACNSSLSFQIIFTRGYNAKKINENMECEIMQVVLEEARESYEEQIVIELESNSIEQMEENVSRIKAWMESWKIKNVA